MVKILKRNGTKVDYNGDKIIVAISKAMEDSGEYNESIAIEIEDEVKAVIECKTEDVDINTIQDLIEDLLMQHGLRKTSKNYILYRAERDKNRDKAWDMTDIQYDIWSQKYEHNNEGFKGFLTRVSGGDDKVAKLIRDKKFLFGGRILAGRGMNSHGIKTTYSNCYVLSPPKDNLESIFDTAKQMARVFSYGGGVGISIENLRPRGSKVHNSAKETTGAVSFMELYSMVTGLIGQNNRRGALMISIPSTHPDLEEFINIKSDLNKVTKANISIMLYDDFMKAVVNKSEYELKFIVEDTGEEISKIVDADAIFTMLAKLNYDYAEPKNWALR